MDSIETEGSVNGTSGGMKAKFKTNAGWLLIFIATLLVIFALLGALYQKPHFNSIRSEPSKLSWDYWGYPVERNAFRRLSVIISNSYDVFALPGGRHIWVVGEGGMIVHSGDGGQSWEAQVSGTKEELYGVAFADAEYGWAVGENGIILATQDGGQSWLPQTSGTKESLLSVAFADTEYGWAVGRFDTILATKDGGQSWQPQASSNRIRDTYNGVSFADAEHGWAVGFNGSILVTKDGGQSWEAQTSGTKERLYGVTFADAEHGWAVGGRGENGIILATQDGGQSWEAQTIGTTMENLTGVAFVDAEHGWAVSQLGSIFATKDGGQSWEAQVSGTREALTGVAFADVEHGWALGRGGTILATKDGGQSWERQTNGIKKIHSVVFADAEHGWAVGGGENGIILATKDGGQSWLPQTSGTIYELSGVAFADAEHGWAVGRFDTILATKDGGQSWEAQTSGTIRDTFNGVTFADAKHGWAVGWYGSILATKDGGQSWQPRTSGTREILSGVAFADVEHGWAVSRGGTILATKDGGQSWEAQTSGTNEILYGVDFADAENGWAVGNNGTILATKDGGQSWEAQTSGTKEILYGVAFTDAEHGWAVGANGTILATMDGGQSWETQTCGTKEALNGVAFADAEYGWAVSNTGTILATKDGGQNWRDIVYRLYPAPWFYLAMLAALIFYGYAWLLLANRRDKSKPNQGIANRVVSDKPAGPGSTDYLGARRIASELTRFLVNRNTQPPVTIAVTGEWGSGKSTVMNYLFAGLKREGLCPVWFNAWHHREEQNVLASILTNVHKQAIKPWWHPAGIWFRLRLLWKRNWLNKSAMLLLTFGAALLISWLSFSRDKWEEAGHYALYLMQIETPIMLGEKGFRTLCPEVAEASVSASEIKMQTPAESNITGDHQKEPDDVRNNAPDKGVFTPEQCRRLLKIKATERKNHSRLECGTGKTQSCYATADNFLEDVEKHLDLELSIETETALLNEVEHLHPEPPVQISSALVKWLTGLAALLGILTVKGMTLMGVAQTKLLKGLLNTSGILLQPAEPVGSRLLFERHFRLITQLLGKRRVVLFIDDLDRCDFEYTRKVLEITNFLASAGDLFMVLGMAPRYVLANVTLSFQDMAKAVHEGDVLNSEKSDALTGKEAGQSWFARHYLQKLIHIEVPVPKAKTAQVLAMLKAEQGEMDKTELLEKQLDSLLAMSGKVLRSFLLLTALGGGIYWGYSLSRPLQTVSGPPETMHKITLSVTSGSGEQAEPKYPPEQRAEPDIEPSSEVFRPGYSSENIENWPAWTLVFIVFVLVFCSFGWIYLIRNAQLIKEKSWLVWLEPVLQRLKVKLLGPELREDSVSFSDALEIWHKLIAITDPSPRNLKAFLNRLRYFASRYPGAADSRREAQLVALATMHYAFDEDMDEALALMRAYETNTLDSKFVTSKLKNDNHWLELKSALKAHWEKFAAFPNKEDREFFKYLCEDIRIHRRD